MMKHMTGMATLLLFLSTTVIAQINRDAPQFTPDVDGVVTAAEMAGQLEVPMIWPIEDGSLILDNAGFEEEDISTIWYVSWDPDNLYIAGVVKDNSPDYRNIVGEGNKPTNGQDAIQPTFNPFNNPDNLFVDNVPAEEDPGDGVAAIYDISIDTADEFGPNIYRHGHLLDFDEWESIRVEGTVDDDEMGYTLETAIPWSAALDDVAPDYVPSLGDEHGLSFLLISYNENGPTLIADFGEGVNTIPDPTTWNSITLVGPRTAPLDLNGDGEVNVSDIDLVANGDLATRDAILAEFNADLGDVNNDRSYDSDDLIATFAAGHYANGEAATYTEGDSDLDGDYDSDDLIEAFSQGSYADGPPATAAAVPEPASCWLLLIGLTLLGVRRK